MPHRRHAHHPHAAPLPVLARLPFLGPGRCPGVGALVFLLGGDGDGCQAERGDARPLRAAALLLVAARIDAAHTDVDSSLRAAASCGCAVAALLSRARTMRVCYRG
eukprot:1672966-Rhodomonas_salina.1